MTNQSHFWRSPYINWHSNIPENWALLVCYIRPARIKAKVVSIVECVSLLAEMSPQTLIGGPLSEHSGVFWVAIPHDQINNVKSKLPRLGYVEKVDLLVRTRHNTQFNKEVNATDLKLVRWRKEEYHLIRLFEEDHSIARKSAPDKRVFLFESHDGKVRPVRGYRGSGAPLKRRALPVYDAKMLVNLVTSIHGGTLLDPFAGVGGIIIEAKMSGLTTVSIDVDPALRFGLSSLSDLHCVANSMHIPFPNETFSAIATEPPYHAESQKVIEGAFEEMYRVLNVDGKLAILCSDWQADVLLQKAAKVNLSLYLSSKINRKGLDVMVLAWRKFNNGNG